MALQINIFLLLSAIASVLAVINIVLIWYFYRTNKKIDTVLKKGNIKDFKDVILNQNERNKDIQNSLKEAFNKIEQLENISKKTIQKVSVVRFNPFNGLQGKQSFVIALLDGSNNGLVVSSLLVKEGSRVYAKAVKNGKSEYLLSSEEIEAINKAMGQN